MNVAIGHNNFNSPFKEVINQFSEISELMFSPFVRISENRKVKKNADIFIDAIIEHSGKKDIGNLIEKEILESMPDGIWNVETISLIETKLKLFFLMKILFLC